MYVCSNIVELYYSFGMQGITVGCFYLYSILSIVQYFKCLYICIYVCICMYGSRTFVLESYKTFMD